MSELASRNAPQLLSPFWPLDDQHGSATCGSTGEPPANAEQVMPLLLKLAAQSDAMRSLQSCRGRDASPRAPPPPCGARWPKGCASWPTSSTTRAPS